jgi:hypothetical protein
MTLNYSLQLTAQIQELIQGDLSGLFKTFLPEEKITNYPSKIERRNRIYTDSTTLLTMITSATQEDKSLQNSVNTFAELHSRSIPIIQQNVLEAIALEREKDSQTVRGRGKPKLYKPRIVKSKLQDISTNTGSYTTARQRLDIDMVKMVYEESANFDKIKTNNTWKGMKVLITDGTYIQMQDSPELRELYDVKCKTENYKSSYPQGLLQLLIEQGSGSIKYFELGSRQESELFLVSKILPKISQGTLILADDLYSSYTIFSLIKKYGLEIIVPGKRVRNYKVIRKICNGDEIVEIDKTRHPEWLSQEEKLPKSLIMRRLSFENPMEPGKEFVIFTTLLDENINMAEITGKYFTRWDIEISIREIKTLMDINVIRSKKNDLVLKEILTTFIAYNLIRKIIATTTENSGFSPQSNILQKYLETGKAVFMDKKGRIYQRWSPGRNGIASEKNS